MKRPTFLLKPSAYKSNTLYAIIPDDGNGDGTVSGYVGNGTRVNEDGLIETVATDTPRINHLGKPHLLMEYTRTNLALNSGTLNNWTASNATFTLNDTIAPDGTTTADKIVDATASAVGMAYYAIVVSDATKMHSWSSFIKFGDRATMALGVRSAAVTNYDAYMDISDDGSISVVADVNSLIESVGSEYYGNGWWRFHAVIDMDNTDSSIRISILPAAQGATLDVDLRGYCWAWGHQLEQGGSPTSYIPTGAGTQQRVYDQINIASVITNGLINETNGSLFVDLYHETIPTVDNTGYMILLGAAGGYLEIRSKANTPVYLDVDNTDLSNNTYDLTSNRSKILFNLFGDTTEAWVNGVKVLETSADMFLTAESLAIRGQSGQIKIYEVAMWDKTLTDAESLKITTK